jgi:hypothetical protein
VLPSEPPHNVRVVVERRRRVKQLFSPSASDEAAIADKESNDAGTSPDKQLLCTYSCFSAGLSPRPAGSGPTSRFDSKCNVAKLGIDHASGMVPCNSLKERYSV